VFNPDYGTLYNVSGALKLNLPLGNNFEGFGRAGLQHSMLADAEQTGSGHVRQRPADRGGFEYRLNLGIGAGSIFVDYTIGRTSLTATRTTS